MLQNFSLFKIIGGNVIMRKFIFVIFQTSLIGWLVSCVPRRRKNETIQAFYKRNGEPIAIYELIRKYEREFQKLHKEETRDGKDFEWPALDKKNLSNYCRKYLQHSVPGRSTDKTSGTKLRKLLCYDGEDTTIKIVILHCKVMNKIHPLAYYMTRAPESNCVYALKYTGSKSRHKLAIIYKHCDFEDKPLLEKKSQKWRRLEIMGKVHQKTGQPIAKIKYLLKYELEHLKMLKNEGKTDECIKWSYALQHSNLDHYCYHYIKECAPNRNREGAKGNWKTEKLNYQQISINKYIEVPVVTCKLPKRLYYITRAPEINCVYALQRHGPNGCAPLIIVFKHCDFEIPNIQQTISQKVNDFDKNVIVKTEVKEETVRIMEMMEFFQ